MVSWSRSPDRAARARSTHRRTSAPRRHSSPMAGSGRSPLKPSAEWLGAAVLLGSLAVVSVRLPARGADPPLAPYEVVGDAIPTPLSDAAADPAHGRAIVVDRRLGLCLLCHSGPFPE